ncbi:unnamed protein product [Discosporangium mesarthrocarpum]
MNSAVLAKVSLVILSIIPAGGFYAYSSLGQSLIPARNPRFLGDRSRGHNPRNGAGGLNAALDITRTDYVEEGCILVASPENFGHFTMQVVGLVYEHGRGTAKAVCLDRGTPFTIGEMTNADFGPLSDNRLFRGGEDGGSACIMIHPHDLEGSRPIGDTGLFAGGISAAQKAIHEGYASREDFKFFFNYMSWPDAVLEEQVGGNHILHVLHLNCIDVTCTVGCVCYVFLCKAIEGDAAVPYNITRWDLLL